MMWGLLILFAFAGLVLVGLCFVAIWRGVDRPPRVTEGTAIARGLPLDPSEVEAAYREVMIEDRLGQSIPLWLIEGEKDTGPDVLLLHGWGDSRHGALRWVPLLSPYVHQIVVFDQQGHGVSPHPRCSWGPEEVEDAREVIRQCDSSRPTVVMGLSMGAAVALGVAADMSESDRAVAGVILDSPYGTAADVVEQTLKSRQMPAWPLARLVFAIKHLRDPRRAEFDLVRLAGKCSSPLLVLHGEADRIVPPSVAVMIADAAARGEAVIFPEADHLDAGCLDEGRYHAALEDFFNSIESSFAAEQGEDQTSHDSSSKTAGSRLS